MAAAEGIRRASLPAIEGEHWVCIGHSHTGALAAANPDMDTINFWNAGDMWHHGAGPRPLREDLAERVTRADFVISMIEGAGHSVLSLAEHPWNFDFVLPSEPDLPMLTGATVIPVDAIRRTLLELSEPLLIGISVLAETYDVPILHIEPPPPLQEITKLGLDAVHRNFIESGLLFQGRNKTFSNKWVRYKAWRLHTQIIAERCVASGVTYLPTPKAVQDKHGFLRPEFDSDGIHGNTDYGVIVLEAVRRARPGVARRALNLAVSEA